MATTTYHPLITGYYSKPVTNNHLFTNFMQWCTKQEYNRLLWLGLGLTFHGCILTPITVLVLAMTGNNLYLLFFCVLAMVLVLISNLAALPTKITIPVLLLSIVMDIIIIITSVFI